MSIRKICDAIIIDRPKQVAGGLGVVALVGITLLVLGLIAHFNHGQVGIFNMSKEVSYSLMGAGAGLSLIGSIGAGAILYLANKRARLNLGLSIVS